MSEGSVAQARAIELENHEKGQQQSPIEDANVFSLTTFQFMSDLMSVGAKRPLEQSDLHNVPAEMRAKVVSEEFDRLWPQQLNRADGKKPRISAVYFQLLKKEIIGSGLFSVVFAFLPFVYPFLVDAFIEYFITFDFANPDYATGIYYSLILGAVALTWAWAQNNALRIIFQGGVKLNAANSTAIFNKVLRLSNNARQKRTPGEIINLMSSDVLILFNILPMFHNLWIAPLQMIVALVLLHQRIGDSMFAGLIVMIVAMPFNGILGARFGTLGKLKQQWADKRLKIITDVIKGIRLVKLYAWENSFVARIAKIRLAEVDVLRDIYVNSAKFMMSIGVLPVIISIAVFAAYASVPGNVLTAQTVFVSLTLLEMVRLPLFILPMVAAFAYMSNVSMTRVRKFLELDESDQDAVEHFLRELEAERAQAEAASGDQVDDKDDESKRGSLCIVDGEFTWAPSFSKDEIAELELELEKKKKMEARKNKGKDKANAKANAKKTDAKSKGKEGASAGASVTSSDQEMVELKQGADVGDGVGKLDSDAGADDGTAGDDVIALEQSSDETAASDERGPEELLDMAKNPAPSTLLDINVDIQPGQLVMVVGSVGSGKSTFLQTFLGANTKVRGSVRVYGKMSYVAQQPWIHNDTLKNNILMGAEYDADRYVASIKAAAMLPDLKVLAAGDLTEIGEQGINLSGGQKARVSLARAIYNRADIYLLDDPLSAVDTHVAQHLFDHMIMGELKDTTRVLVTNQLQFLEQADQIIFLEDGRVSEMGTYEECMANRSAFYSLVQSHAGGNEEEDETAIAHAVIDDVPESSATEAEDSTGVDHVDADNLGRLMDKELRNVGKVEGGIWRPYVDRAGGMRWFTGFLVVALIATVIRIFTQYFLVIWTNDLLKIPLAGYIALYSLWGILAAVLTYARELYLVGGFKKASNELHGDMLRSILDAPMRFFDATPIGRILNRFSKDQYVVDSELPGQLSQYFNAFFVIVSLMLLISSVAFFMPILIVIIGVFYYKLQNYYRNSSRELQRLENLSKSPVIAHFTETLNGLDTIRSLGLQEMFRHYNDLLVDFNHKAFFTLKMASRWFDMRIAVMGAVTTMCTGLFLVLALMMNLPVDPAQAGLALSSVVGFAGLLNYFVFMIAEVEVRMTNLERVVAYTVLPREEVTKPAIAEAPESWPSKGHVVFDHYNMRYREGLDLVLKDICLDIRPGEKIGVVGRTGAGKSSLILALTRMVEADSGSIIIDDIDVSKLPLTDVRSRVAIIPQAPTLFEGSLRFNLDPFEENNDQDVWAVLESIRMKETVSALKGKLSYHVAEGGTNFSVGERQLICIGRALLRKCALVLMDEATASVDVETDALIQHAVRNMFVNQTVITIAHRLNTIMDSTRILVMDKGHVAEFDTPSALLEDSDSLFYKLASQTGKQNLQHLTRLANGTASLKLPSAALENTKTDVGAGVSAGTAAASQSPPKSVRDDDEESEEDDDNVSVESEVDLD